MDASSARRHQHLTDEELAEFREIFNLVDLDKGGTISKDELKQLMNTLGLKPSQEELNAMVDEIDADGNGEIDFDGALRRHPARARGELATSHPCLLAAEFVTVMSRKVNTSYTPAQVKAAFKVFERECPPGYVTMSALEQALTTFGSEKLSLSDAQELLSQIEPDENGYINYVEFVNMMTGDARTPRTRAPEPPRDAIECT
jgi:calmodulin